MNMPLAILNRRRRGFTAFSPSALFALAEPGVWYDPSDLTTLYQDTAGTTPVTAAGQTVALMLDKSKGLALGTELVTNGDFSGGTTGWTATGATLSVDTGRLKILSLGGTYAWAYQAFTTVVGRTYRLTYSLTNGDATACYLYVDTAAGTGAANYDSGVEADGTYTAVFVATATTTYVKPFIAGSGKFAFYDNISVRELAGNHATQSIFAARPTYSIEPVGGRRNLLTYSEDLTNAAWLKAGVSVSGNVITATSTTGAVYRSVTIAPAATHTLSVKLKAGSAPFAAIRVLDFSTSGGAWFNLSSGAVGTVDAGLTAFISPIDADGYYRCEVRFSATPDVSGDLYIYPTNANSSYSVTVGNTIQAKEAQLELGSTATNYQRVTTQHDVTEAGVASVSYLYFDGAGDNMVTSTITPGIDKAQIFAGVRKLSDATAQVIAETGTNSFGTSGSLALLSGAGLGSNLNSYALFGTGSSGYAADFIAFTAPISNVLTGQFDIAQSVGASEVFLRANGATATRGSTTGTTLGTGNFLAYPLYLGGRAGTSLFFNGHLYSLITRFGATLDAPTIASTEAYVAGKTGINIANNISPTIFARDDTAVLDRFNQIIERRA